MGVLRPRNKADEASPVHFQRFDSAGVEVARACTLSFPNIRGSTKRSSRPEASFATR